METIYIFIEVIGNPPLGDPPLGEWDRGMLEPITRIWIDDGVAIMGKHILDAREDLCLLADDVDGHKPEMGYFGRGSALRVPVAVCIMPEREPSTFPWGAS